MATAKVRPSVPRAGAARDAVAPASPRPTSAPKGAPPPPKSAAKAAPPAAKRAAKAAPAATKGAPAATKAAAKAAPSRPEAARVATPARARTKASPAPASGAPAAPASAAPAGAASGLAPGDLAPPFALASDAGTTVSLRDFAGKSLVLYFYPKDDTPGCTREACAFQAALGALAARGAAVVGVSRDAPARHGRFKAKYGLSFPLLCDPDGATHRAYGAWGVKKLYGRESIGPLRTTVVVDGAGRVARVFSNVRVDGHVDQVLAALGG